VLRIFIALKNSSSRPGMNPRPLVTVARTLATTPQRRLSCDIIHSRTWPKCKLSASTYHQLMERRKVKENIWTQKCDFCVSRGEKRRRRSAKVRGSRRNRVWSDGVGTRLV
jgi:hypothetical protein